MTLIKEDVPIYSTSEISKYGFDPTIFRTTGRDRLGGYVVEGPCPFGCNGNGDDRLTISNSYYWCRVCGSTNHLNNLVNGRKIRQTQEEIGKIRKKAEQAERDRKRKQRQNLKILNNGRTKLWTIWHKELKKRPDRIAKLAADGVSIKSINKHIIGFNPQFRAFDFETGQFKTVPAFTFPHFQDRSRRKCLNVRNRILDDEISKRAKYLPWRSGLPQSYFPAFDRQDKNFVVILEGEKKAIVLKEHGIPAIGLWGINNVKDEWIEFWKTRFERRYIMFDGDNWNVINQAIRYEDRMSARAVFLHKKPDDALVSGKITAHKILFMLGET